MPEEPIVDDTQLALPSLPPATPEPDLEPDGVVTWEAPEFVGHDKSISWYLSLGAAAIVLAIVVYLATRDAVSSAVIIAAALILGTYGGRKPRKSTNQISLRGLAIGPRGYSFDQFKSYSLKPEGSFGSIIFTPLKRFAPFLTLYYPIEEEAKILAILSSCLPYEEPRRDVVDSLMRRIRF